MTDANGRTRKIPIVFFLITSCFSLFFISCPCPHLCDAAKFGVRFAVVSKDYPSSFDWYDTIGKNIDTFYAAVVEEYHDTNVQSICRPVADIGNVYGVECVDCIDRLSIDFLSCNRDIIIQGKDTIPACSNLINNPVLRSDKISIKGLKFTREIELPLGEVVFKIEGDLERVGRITGLSKLFVVDSIYLPRDTL